MIDVGEHREDRRLVLLDADRIVDRVRRGGRDEDVLARRAAAGHPHSELDQRKVVESEAADRRSEHEVRALDNILAFAWSAELEACVERLAAPSVQIGPLAEIDHPFILEGRLRQLRAGRPKVGDERGIANVEEKAAKVGFRSGVHLQRRIDAAVGPLLHMDFQIGLARNREIDVARAGHDGRGLSDIWSRESGFAHDIPLPACRRKTTHKQNQMTHAGAIGKIDAGICPRLD